MKVLSLTTDQRAYILLALEHRGLKTGSSVLSMPRRIQIADALKLDEVRALSASPDPDPPVEYRVEDVVQRSIIAEIKGYPGWSRDLPVARAVTALLTQIESSPDAKS